MNIGVYTKDSRLLTSIKQIIGMIIEQNSTHIKLFDWNKTRNALFVIEDLYCDGLIVDVTNNNQEYLYELITKFSSQNPNKNIIVIFDKLDDINWILKYKIFSYINHKSIKIELKNTLKIFLKDLTYKNERALELVSKRKYEKIFYNEILYITRDGKNIKIHTIDNRCITFRMSLVKAYESLSEGMFRYIDKGCIINTSFIISADSNEVRLFNGLKLPISREGLKRIMDLVKNESTYIGCCRRRS